MGSCSIGEIDVSHGANGSATPLDRCRSSEPSPGARDPHSLAARDMMLRWARWSWLCVVAGGLCLNFVTDRLVESHRRSNAAVAEMVCACLILTGSVPCSPAISRNLVASPAIALRPAPV
jgi:hypothetical protein